MRDPDQMPVSPFYWTPGINGFMFCIVAFDSIMAIFVVVVNTFPAVNLLYIDIRYNDKFPITII